MTTPQKIMIPFFLGALVITYWLLGFENIPVYFILVGGFVVNFLAAGHIDEIRERTKANRANPLSLIAFLCFVFAYELYYLLPLIVYFIDFSKFDKDKDDLSITK